LGERLLRPLSRSLAHQHLTHKSHKRINA
jgi:hypothetical protein